MYYSVDGNDLHFVRSQTFRQRFRDWSTHVDDQSVGTPLPNLSCTTAFHLKAGRMVKNDLRGYKESVVALKRIEMRLDFHAVIECLTFLPIKLPIRLGRSAVDVKRQHREQFQQHCKCWAEYLQEEKARQMQVQDPEVWPPKPWPWPFDDLMAMPVVVWVSHDK